MVREEEMMGKLQLCLRWSKVFLLGLSSSLVTILILFTISSSNYSSQKHLLKTQRIISRNYNKPLSNLPLWTVLEDKVVIHSGIHPNPHEYTYIVNNPNLCHSLSPSTPAILIFIESHVENHQRRKSIRDTWGVIMLQTSLNFRLLFLLGASTTPETQKRVEQEHYLYGDVLQENFTDSFPNLGLKSVMGLKWSSTFCRQAAFIVKTDDDIFIHVPNLLKMMTSFDNRESLLVCHRNRVRRIIRDNTQFGKYEVQFKDLPGMYFPEYCAGFAYVMSMDTVDKLYKACLSTPYFFIEDVYVTGFCRYKADVKLIDHVDVTLRPSLTPAQTSCAFADGRVTSHELVDKELEMLWEQLNTRGFFCPQPIQ